MKDFKQVFNANFDTDVGYLVGKARNEDVDGDGTGSPWHQIVINDLMMGPVSALFNHSDVVADNSDEKAGQSQWIDALKTLAKDMNWGDRYKGSFAKGFTYTGADDVGRGQDGEYYKYIGSDPLPKSVPAGLNPVNFPTEYALVENNSASTTTTNTTESTQDFIDSFALKIFQSPTDGGLTEIQTRTINGGEVYEVRKVSDGELATIYSDKDGDNEINQNGTSNVSGSDGVVTFFVNDGDYYVEVDSVKSNFLTLYNKSFVTPAMYGLVEGYDAGNAVKIEAMIASGKKIKWGSGSYGVDRCIGGGASLVHSLIWESEGCTLFMDSSASHQQAVMWYSVPAKTHSISGEMTFDANNKANVGLFVENLETPNYPAGYAAITTENITAKNILRTLDFLKGDGILIEGAFSSIIMNSPVASNCVMAIGAGIEGSQGVSGITVSRDSVSGGYPLYVEINNPTISEVYSLDPTYNRDQDGLKVFGGVAGSAELTSSAIINGGAFSNCHGRSIKGQCSSLEVKATTFNRDSGWSNANAKAEIDSQYCKPTVKNITCKYNGFTPESIVIYSSNPDGYASAGEVNGISITGQSVETLNSIISSFSYYDLGQYSVKNVETRNINVSNAILFRCPDDTAEISCENFDISNLTGSFVKVLKQARVASTAVLANISIKDIVNRGAPVDLVESLVSGFSMRAILSSSGRVTGFNQQNKLSVLESNKPNIATLEGYSGTYTEGSFFKPMSESVDGGGQYEFPTHGYASGVRMAFVYMSFGIDNQGIIAASSAGAAALSVGSGMLVGESSEPAGSASIKVWINTATGGLVVKNNTGSSKHIGVYYM